MMNVEKTSLIPSWQQEMQSAFTKIDDLLQFLALEPDDLRLHYKAAKDFPLLVTKSYADRIVKSDWHDPLLLQALPTPNELKRHPDFLNDPVGDGQALVSPGLLHKYHGRVLLITTAACAMGARIKSFFRINLREGNAWSCTYFAKSVMLRFMDSAVGERSGGDV